MNTPLLAGWVKDPATKAIWEKTNCMNRLGEPDEIAAVVCFLLGPESSFVNGAVSHTSGVEISSANFPRTTTLMEVASKSVKDFELYQREVN